MKKAWLFLLGGCFFVFISATSVAGQLDPFWKVQRNFKRGAQTAAKGAEPAPVPIDVFVKTSDIQKTAERIISIGGSVRTMLGSIMTCTIPSDVIESAVEWEEVSFVESAKPLRLMNDLANADTGADEVHLGSNLPRAYDGSGVIVGVVDSGVDLSHPAFNDEYGESRVLFLWDQSDDSGTGPAEIESTYGTEYDHAKIIAGATNEIDTVGHGTHVTATAAGRDEKYSGVAPGASIISVKFRNIDMEDPTGNLFSTWVCDGAYYIFSKAADLGMPAVVNFSLGTHLGAHDGTSLLEQCLDELVADRSGRAIIAAAGNEGSSPNDNVGIHARLSAEDGATGASVLLFDSDSSGVLDMWGSKLCDVDIAVALSDGATRLSQTDWVPIDSEIEDAELHDEEKLLSTVSVYRSGIQPENEKWRAITIINTQAEYDPEAYRLEILIRGECPFADAWAEGMMIADVSEQGFYPGDDVSSVGLPATAAGVVAVGAHVTRKSWTDIDGIHRDDSMEEKVGELAYFSSRGPAISVLQGTKPNITAPGAHLISAHSSKAEISEEERAYLMDETHIVMAGTSMATPHVTGIVALMFQANPKMGASGVTKYLQDTARSDEFTGSIPNDDWGYGKVDAKAAVSAAVEDSSSGGCSLSAGARSSILFMWIAVAATCIFFRRLRMRC